MSKVEDQVHLQTSIPELEARYTKLQQAYDNLSTIHEQLKQNNNLLIETVLTKDSKEKKYTNIIENAPSALFLTKPDGSILEANKNACEMLGYTEEELKQIGKKRVLDENDLNVVKLLAQRKKFGKARGEVTVIRKNGEYLKVDISSFVFKDRGTGEERITTVMIDITEKKHAERELHKSNEWANLIFNNTSDLMFLMSVEPDQVFRCLKVNPAYTHLTGLTTKEIVGKTIEEILPGDACRHAIMQYKKAIRMRRTISYEESAELPGGNVVVETKLTPLFTDAGECNLLLGVSRNISERKKAEQIIQENDRRMKNAQYVGGVGDWEYDCGTRKTIWSDELFRLFAKDPDKGAPAFEEFFSFYLSNDAAILKAATNRTIDTGESYELDLQLHLPSQPEAYHYTVGQALRDKQGKIVKLYGIVQDITDRKLAEIKLNAERTQLKILIGNLPDSIYIKDVHGRKIITNQVDMHLVGATSESDILGKTDLEIFSNHLGPKAYADDMEVIKTGKAIYNREERFVDKEGAPVWLLTSKVPLRNETGDINGLLGIGRIITERKKSEEDLRISNERYVYATKATFDAIWDWDIINDYLYWGEGYEKIFGYKNSDKIENHINSFDNIHPDERKQVFEGIDILIVGAGLNWTGEYRYMKANGEYAYVQDKAIIVRDKDGKAIRMIGAMQDVTERKTVEETNRKTQEKFTNLVNTVDGIVWEADAQTFQFTYVSKHAEKLLGYTTQEWITNPGFWASHIHPDDRDWAVDYCVNSTKEKKQHQFEYRMIAANGNIIWLADFVTVTVEMGKPVQLQGIMIDITERKKAEQHLKLLESVITNATDSILITEAEPFDLPGPKIIYANEAFVKMTGYSQEELIGKTPRILQGPKSDIKVLKKVRQAIENWEPCEAELINYRKNGEEFWISFSLVPIANEKGLFTHWISIERDITERKKAEEALVKERKLLRVLIDNIPDYIYVKDRNSRHIINNKANIELLGFTKEEETLGKTMVDILGRDIAGEFIKDDQHVLESGIPIINREEPIFNKEGDKRWLLTTKIPFKDEENNIIGLVGISRDVTDRKRIEEELTEKNIQLKNLSKHLQNVREEERKFLAREVHDELGQLASVVKMDVDWLNIKLANLQEMQKKRIQHASSTADLLIKTIRKIASTLRPSMLDDLGLNASLEWQCKEFTSVNGIPCVFEQEFYDEGLTVETKTELFRICQESLTNIMRHAHATHVTVSITEKENDLYLCISDNGKGFDTREKKDTLGLIGMRERVFSINGKLKMKSEPGKGTIVCAIVPTKIITV